MFVGEVMTRSPRVVTPSTTAAEAAAIMREEQVDSLVVVGQETAVGLLSATDLQSTLQGAEDGDRPDLETVEESEREPEGESPPVSELCSHVVFTAHPDEEIVEVQQFMLGLGIDRVVVLDGGEVVGLATLEQLSTALATAPTERRSA